MMNSRSFNIFISFFLSAKLCATPISFPTYKDDEKTLLSTKISSVGSYHFVNFFKF